MLTTENITFVDLVHPFLSIGCFTVCILLHTRKHWHWCFREDYVTFMKPVHVLWGSQNGSSSMALHLDTFLFRVYFIITLFALRKKMW